MARGALVLYFETPENSEVCGDAGLSYSGQGGLTARIREVLEMSEPERNRYRARAVERVRERYDWDVVTRQYEDLLKSLRN